MVELIKPILKAVIPKPQRDWLRDKLSTLSVGNDTYEKLYDNYARDVQADQVVGHGDFDLIGRTELALLQMEGLKPDHTLVDLGCGVGRLAVHVIPTMAGGSYIGIDISQTMLKRAKARIAEAVPAPACRIEWVKQTTPHFELPENSVDMMCAFSVFTHMEHEDSYRYLKGALSVVKPGGRFIFSCTPLTQPIGKQIFLNSASLDLKTRWSYVRNVTTSIDYMTEIARLAGWTPLRWYAADGANIGPSNNGKMYSLDQACCVLEPAART
ncbi:MAG TPA: class I SAM-dependent methyltransferase [Pyrinomonadaceae bacterium]|nr:class I SAM-dependent methyltransferase [Pyrinomonadaceae bacterium]